MRDATEIAPSVTIHRFAAVSVRVSIGPCSSSSSSRSKMINCLITLPPEQRSEAIVPDSLRRARTHFDGMRALPGKRKRTSLPARPTSKACSAQKVPKGAGGGAGGSYRFLYIIALQKPHE